MDTQTYNVKRYCTGLRSYAFAGKRIGRIVLHDGSKILHTLQQGWIEAVTNKESYYSTRDVVALDIPDIRTARKIDLTKKDSFIVAYHDNDKSYYESGYALYIYVKDFTFIEEYHVLSDDGNEDRYRTLYSFSISAEILLPKLDENEKLVYQAEPVKEGQIWTSNRTVLTDKGLKLKNLTDSINESLPDRCHLYGSQVEKLLERFDIIKR